jgi:hypothetical protein
VRGVACMVSLDVTVGRVQQSKTQLILAYHGVRWIDF